MSANPAGFSLRKSPVRQYRSRARISQSGLFRFVITWELDSMKCLLLIAHGSRRQSANDEIKALADRIAGRADNDYAAVVPAFLELAEPNIHEGIKHCIDLGASDIVVMPYFLAAGNHVNKDIPGEIACARAGAPGVRIEMSQYLGANEAMAGLVLDCARRTG